MNEKSKEEPKHGTLKSKIVGGLIALGAGLGMISASDITLRWQWIAIAVVFVIALMIYWHVIYQIQDYFTNLSEDVKYIKNSI